VIKIIDKNKILIEWAYRTRDGLPNPKSMSHQIILEGVLKDFGWGIEARSELIGNLMEADAKKVPNQNPKTKARWPMVSPETNAKYLAQQRGAGEEDETGAETGEDDEDGKGKGKGKDKGKGKGAGEDDEGGKGKDAKDDETGDAADTDAAAEKSTPPEVEKITKNWPEPKEGGGKNRDAAQNIRDGSTTLAQITENAQKDGILGMQGDDTTPGVGGAGGYFNESQFGASFTEMSAPLRGDPIDPPPEDPPPYSTGSKKLSEKTAEERAKDKKDWIEDKKVEARQVLQDEIDDAKRELKKCDELKDSTRKQREDCKKPYEKKIKHLEGRQKQVGKPEGPKSENLSEEQIEENKRFNNGEKPPWKSKTKKGKSPNEWIEKKLESAAGGIDEIAAMEMDPFSDFDMDNQPEGYPTLTVLNEESNEGMRAALEVQADEYCAKDYIEKNGRADCKHAKHELEKFEKQVIGSERSEGGRSEGKADTAIMYYDSKGRLRIKYVNNKESESDIQNNNTVRSRLALMEEVRAGKKKEIDDELAAEIDEIKGTVKNEAERDKQIAEAEARAEEKKARIDDAAKASAIIDNNAVDEANQMNRIFAAGVRSLLDSQDPPFQVSGSAIRGVGSHITERAETGGTTPKYFKNAIAKAKRKPPNPVREAVKDKPGEVAEALGKVWIVFTNKERKGEIALYSIKKGAEHVGAGIAEYIPHGEYTFATISKDDALMDKMFEEIDKALSSKNIPNKKYTKIGDIIVQAALDSAGKEGQESISDSPGGAGNKLIMKILRTSRSVRTKLETRGCRKVGGKINPDTGKCNKDGKEVTIPAKVLKKVAREMEAEGLAGGMSAKDMLSIYNDPQLEKLEKEYERRAKNWEGVHGRIVDNHHRLDVIEHLEDGEDKRAGDAKKLNEEIQNAEQRLRDIRDAQAECAKTPPPRSVKVTPLVKGGKSKLKCENLADEMGKTLEAYEALQKEFDELVSEDPYAVPLDDNGTSTQVFIRSFMDGMGWTDYIMNEDGEESKNMGSTPYQPRDIRACLAELSGYEGPPPGGAKEEPGPQPPNPPNPDGVSEEELMAWRKGLIEHLEKELRVDSDSGAVTFCGETDTQKKAGDEIDEYIKNNPRPEKPKSNASEKSREKYTEAEKAWWEDFNTYWKDKHDEESAPGYDSEGNHTEAGWCSEVGTDSWRTAGDDGKVEGKLGGSLKSCLKEKGKKYTEQQPPKDES